MLIDAAAEKKDNGFCMYRIYSVNIYDCWQVIIALYTASLTGHIKDRTGKIIK